MSEVNNNLIKVDSTPAIFSADFDKAEKALKRRLKKFDVVVTLDTLPDAKKLATDLNKQASEIDTARKDAVAEVSTPIKEFDASMKALVKMCKDGREKILSQVTVFEDETRTKVKVLLQECRDELFIDLNVKDEFKSAVFDDLIILSNITGKGALTSKAKVELERRVTEDSKKQMMVEIRILKLKNESYEAGLTTPLEMVHVKDFIHAPDDEYNAALTQLLEVEVKRQKATEEALRRKHDDEHKRQQEIEAKNSEVPDEKIKEVNDEATLPAESKNKETVQPEKVYVPSTVEESKRAWLVSVDFEISTGKDAKPEAIEKRITELLAKSGIEVKEIKLNRG